MRSMIGAYLGVSGYYGTLSLLPRQDNDIHTPLHAGAVCSETITFLQKAIHLPKAFMVNAIKSHLITLLGTPPPGVNSEEKY
jgi:hypothetical protein